MARMLVKYLREHGRTVINLDGDELRKILLAKTYSRKDRVDLGLTYSRLCKFLISEQINVVIGVIGLWREVHLWNRNNIDGYIEIFLDTPISELRSRDPKGLYRKYDNNEIKDVAGLDLKVDFPSNPDIHIVWNKDSTEQTIFEELKKI